VAAVVAGRGAGAVGAAGELFLPAAVLAPTAAAVGAVRRGGERAAEAEVGGGEDVEEADDFRSQGQG